MEGKNQGDRDSTEMTISGHPRMFSAGIIYATSRVCADVGRERPRVFEHSALEYAVLPQCALRSEVYARHADRPKTAG